MCVYLFRCIVCRTDCVSMRVHLQCVDVIAGDEHGLISVFDTGAINKGPICAK